ncbi:MAG TPA: AMP-binding protein, partial [bacterium]|nr:AMP-binding protein [bacterium]
MTVNKKKDPSLEALLQENRTFPPSPDFQKNAWAKDLSIYENAALDPEAYWASWAKELDWTKPWKTVLEWKPPHAKWFVGGKINACVNCVDRHVFPSGDRPVRKNKAAIIWEGEPGDTRTLTYWDLYREVNKFASVLTKMGIKKGDRVALYLPMIPELAIACLACARLGVIHSVVFGGFSAEALRDRINDAEAKLLITADFGWRRGNQVQLKKAADEALQEAPSIKNVIVVQRAGGYSESPLSVHIKEGRDHWWHRLM